MFNVYIVSVSVSIVALHSYSDSHVSYPCVALTEQHCWETSLSYRSV